jgi:hypothetical protein
MPNLKVEMRLLNARHVAFSGFGVADPIFSEPTFTVEHERRLESAEIGALPNTLLIKELMIAAKSGTQRTKTPLISARHWWRKR